jgi:NAD(P)-dependent dehydrogenase (short-subunit alcohol dehydrogenase family)
MSDRFVGRKLVVTGGSSGMGLATAATVVAEGGSAVLVGRNQTKLDAAVQSLGDGAQLTTIAGDLNDSAQVDAIVETITRDHPDTSMLVNSAGFFIPKDFLDYDVSAYDSYMDINRGTFFLTQGVAKVMIARGGGSIVNIASTAAKRASAGQGMLAHSAAKAAVIAMTRQYATEGAPHGIRANTISPGMIRSAQTEPLMKQPGWTERAVSRQLIKRIGEPQDVVAAALFLASDEASFITGTDLGVDGGTLAA